MTRQKKTGRGFTKSSRSAHASAGPSSGRRKFYAVRGGRDGFCGVLNSWDECKVQVTGVSGVTFKSFRTYDEALAFAQNRPQEAPFTERKKKFYAVNYNGFHEVFASWEECSVYVKGVPNAQYKGFQNYEEAQMFAAGETEESGRGRPLNAEGGNVLTAKADSIPGVAGVVVDVDNAGAETRLPDVDLVNPDSNFKPEPKEHLIVFTDGACTNNGKSNSMAGYGAFFGEGSPLNISKPLPGRATNQRAEMTAVLQTMRTVLRKDLVLQGGMLEIRTDSQYTKNGLDKWVGGWKRKNWKTAAGGDVKNRDLWVALDLAKTELHERAIRLHLVWVKGHAGIPGNEAADRLAVAGIYST